MPMKIKIVDKKLKETCITVNSSDTIGEGKRLFSIANNLSSYNDQWKFNAIVLRDNKTFDFYEIEDDDIIETNGKSEGGNK